MNTLRRPRDVGPGDVKPHLPPSRPFLLSLVLHIVIIAVLGRFLVSPGEFSRIFGGRKSPPVPAERIGFLVLPKAAGQPVQGRSGGDGRPETKSAPRRLVAPTEIPRTIPPPVPPTAAREPERGSGPLVGSGGPARGVRPTYSDPRLWPAPADIVTAPKSAKMRLDSVVASVIAPFNDSVAVAAGKRKPGDWTFERDGKKYGIDPQYIRLGKVSIPTAVLALLPINTTGNPTVNERNKLQSRIHDDISYHARRGMNEVDFKKAVKSIRERKERERAEATKKERPANSPAAEPPRDRN